MPAGRVVEGDPLLPEAKVVACPTATGTAGALVRQFRFMVVALVDVVVRLVPAHATWSEVPAAIVWLSAPEDDSSRTTAKETSKCESCEDGKEGDTSVLSQDSHGCRLRSHGRHCRTVY